MMRRAFTLVELLCVIAIIAILAALLLPAIERASGQGKRIACANNCKQMGAAFHAWAHDHNDLFPMQVSTNQGRTRAIANATASNPDVSSTFRQFQAGAEPSGDVPETLPDDSPKSLRTTSP